jgi:CubicO group peptidase (beta-lactamase class C family)
MPPDTLSVLSSVTKSHTATALMRLIAEGSSPTAV